MVLSFNDKQGSVVKFRFRLLCDSRDNEINSKQEFQNSCIKEILAIFLS